MSVFNKIKERRKEMKKINKLKITLKKYYHGKNMV